MNISNVAVNVHHSRSVGLADIVIITIGVCAALALAKNPD